MVRVDREREGTVVSVAVLVIEYARASTFIFAVVDLRHASAGDNHECPRLQRGERRAALRPPAHPPKDQSELLDPTRPARTA